METDTNNPNTPNFTVQASAGPAEVTNIARFPDLENKVVLITGAARGIGKCIAEAFAEQKSRLMLVDLNPNVAETALSISHRYSVQATHGTANVTMSGEVKAAVGASIKAYGQLDVLVNNAGITRDKLALRMSDEDWKAVIDTNLTGAFYFFRESLRYLRKTEGAVINISSIVALLGNAGQINYCAAKAGMIGMIKCINQEYGKSIRAYAICPGFIQTDMTSGLPEQVRRSFLQSTPQARAGTPREVAEAVVCCAAKYGSSFKNGAIIPVAGGLGGI